MNSHLYVVSIYKVHVSVNKGVAVLLDEVSKVSIVSPPPPPPPPPQEINIKVDIKHMLFFAVIFIS
jgi:hypothetical protein